MENEKTARESSHKLRWRIADLMNRLPNQCWTDLVMWALYGPEWAKQAGDSRLPWRPIGAACREDAARCGACYCGKIGEQAPSKTGA